MSKINPKRAYAKEIIESFSRIGARGMDTPINFRIREDGSLEKRCGWRVYETFSQGTVRGVWQGVLNGVSLRFVVCGTNILLIRSSGRVSVGSLATASGSVSFFVYQNALYLMDGQKLRVWDEGEKLFRVAEGYAPLYGTNWDPTRYGDVNEDLNLFSNRLRIHYHTNEPATQFMLPFYAESIDHVKANGVTTTAYTFSSTLDSITLEQAAKSVEIAFTIYLDNESMENLHAVTQALPTYLGSAEQLLLYGAPRGQYLYTGKKVTEVMHAASRSCYANSDPLYFRERDVMIIGNNENPITTVCRDSQRLLAFHPSGVSAIYFPVDEEPTYYALSTIPGCTVRGMDISVGGDRYVLNRSGFFRLVQDSGAPDGLQAIPLGLPIPTDDPALLSRLSAAYDPVHSEIWLYDPTDTTAYVYVYHPLTKQHYRFDNVPAVSTLTLDGRFGFLFNQSICVFEEDLKTDRGLTFEATVTTDWLHFGTPEMKKRSLRASLLAYDANGLRLTLESEHRSCRISHAADAFSGHFWDTRVPIGRFRTVRAVIRDVGQERPRIVRLALYANL